MPIRKLLNYLDENKVKYEVIPHTREFTAQDVAASLHIRSKEVAKTIILRIDGELVMTVLPASLRLDLSRVKDSTGANKVEIASEGEFEELFPECEPGAMPPFGPLYGLREFVDRTLREDEKISFNAGTHDEVIRMSYSDFERLTRPVVVPIAH